MVKYVQLLYSKNNLCNEIYLQLQFAAILYASYSICSIWIKSDMHYDNFEASVTMTTVHQLCITNKIITKYYLN
jgi:hypothetical protein